MEVCWDGSARLELSRKDVGVVRNDGQRLGGAHERGGEGGTGGGEGERSPASYELGRHLDLERDLGGSGRKKRGKRSGRTRRGRGGLLEGVPQ